jgi:hypothetical protein
MKNYDDDGNNKKKQKGNATSKSDRDAVYEYDTTYFICRNRASFASRSEAEINVVPNVTKFLPRLRKRRPFFPIILPHQEVSTKV